ncbi:MAG TPA: TetR/AcrR family transcriptional regulator [Chroococcales cyanobacterium]
MLCLNYPDDAIKALKLHPMRGGYDGTGVQEITNEAGVNKAMLYYYFKSKEELYDSLLDEGIDKLAKAVAASEGEGFSLEERLRRFLDSYLSAAISHPDLAILICSELVGMRGLKRRRVVDKVSDTIKQLTALLTTAREKKEVREEDPSFAAYALFGIVTIFISRHLLKQQELEPKLLIDRIVDLYLHGLGVRS